MAFTSMSLSPPGVAVGQGKTLAGRGQAPFRPPRYDRFHRVIAGPKTSRESLTFNETPRS